MITGGSSGLGLAMKTLLQIKGIEVTSVSRSDPKNPIDLTTKAGHAHVSSLIETHPFDLVIHNAGFGLYGPCLSLSIDKQIEMVELHITAQVHIALQAAKAMRSRKQKGVIAIVSSAAAFFPFPYFNLYASSKGFALSFTKALHEELSTDGICVLCSCPGPIKTSFREHASQGHPQREDRCAISAEKAAEYLWKQICSRKQLAIFDWKIRCMMVLSKAIPFSLLSSILKKQMKERIDPKCFRN